MANVIDYRLTSVLILLALLSSLTVCALDITQMPGFPKQTGIGGGLIFHDLDKDGIDEIIVTGNGNVFAWRIDGTSYLNNPDGVFFSVHKDFYIFAPPAIGDITGNGTDEIVISADRVYVIDPNGNLIMDVEIGGESRAVPVVADINRDGSLEIIGIGHSPGAYSVFIYDNNGEPMPGFPMGNVALSSPAVLDFDPDVTGLELVWGETSGEVLAVHHDGSHVNGFPVPSQGELGIGEYPTAGDIDNDGTPEIVIGTYNRTLLVIDENGKFKPGWPVQTEKISSSAAIADIDHDGSLEIFAGSYEGDLYGFDSGGNQLTGFPKKTGGKVSSLIIADIDNDNVLEVIAGSEDGKLYAWKTANGNVVDGFPIDHGMPVYYSPIVGTDGNGHTLLGISVGENFYLYDLGPGTYNPDMQPWPMMKHDPQRTGNYHYTPDEQEPDRTPPQWVNTVGIQNAFQIEDNTVRIHWNRATDTESVKYNLYISAVLYGAVLPKRKIADITPAAFNLSEYDYELDINPSVAELKECSAYRFEITAEDSASNETIDVVFKEVHILDFMTVSEINATLLSNPSSIVDKEVITEIMGLSYNSSLLAEAVDIGKSIHDILTLKKLGDLLGIGLGLGGIDPTAFAKNWLKERTTYRAVVGTNPGENLDWYQVVSPVDSDPRDQIGKGWPAIAKVRVIEKSVFGENHHTLDVISFHHNWNRFSFLPSSSYLLYSFDHLNNSEINRNLIGVKGALIGCIESRKRDGANVIFRLHNLRSTDEKSMPVYIKTPFSDERLPTPHSVVGIYGTIGTYQGYHCIEADGIDLIIGNETPISNDEGWQNVNTAYVISAVESPVDLHIYDSLGNHTGAVYDPQGNVTRIELGIPNSLYLGPDSHPELILITDPTTGPYRQELKGIEDGNYTLTTIAVDRNNEEIYRIERKDRPIAKDEIDLIGIPVVQNEEGELIVDKSLAVDPSIDNLEVEPPHVTRQNRPEQTMLLQNFPNPSNPETWIPYQLAEGANVTIHIYTMDGRLIKALNMGYKQVGYYTSKGKAAYWDGRNERGEKVASGVFYYSIQAGAFSAVRKMILLE